LLALPRWCDQPDTAALIDDGSALEVVQEGHALCSCVIVRQVLLEGDEELIDRQTKILLDDFEHPELGERKRSPVSKMLGHPIWVGHSFSDCHPVHGDDAKDLVAVPTQDDDSFRWWSVEEFGVV
jgi:hypothetical protein